MMLDLFQSIEAESKKFRSLATRDERYRCFVEGTWVSATYAEMESRGVYFIRNGVNGTIYVGSTASSFRRRWQRHLAALNSDSHYNIALQTDWHAGDHLTLWLAEQCDPGVRLPREQFWMNRISQQGTVLYNERFALGQETASC